jgi:hypothetical protein
MPSGLFKWGTVSGTALWQWDTSVPDNPVATGYNGYYGTVSPTPTKTGMLPSDLQMTCGVPLQFFAPAGNTVGAVPPELMIEWIRQSEDWVEQETGLLLTPTWIASPPEIQPLSIGASQAPSLIGGSQVQGQDYDLADTGYDFYNDRFADGGWGAQPLRYRPIRNVQTSAADFTAVKNIAAIYPLLSQFFRVPPTWYVEDQDFGLIRLVPAANVAMLPLFAMEISMMGFSESVPGAWHFQYTAGLTRTDYSTRFRFMRRLVLLDAAMRALGTIQGSINMGLMRAETLVDGLQVKLQYSEKGPFGSIIETFKRERDELMGTALNRVSGPVFMTI